MNNISTNSNTSKNEQIPQFKSRWGFLLAAVGSAVGMANVWGFPYKVGQYGGGAFIFAYLVFVVIFGFVGLAAEYAVGRRSRTGTVGTFQKSWGTADKEHLGKCIGWLPLAGSMCIAIGYSVIIAYILKALTDSATGSLMTVNTESWFQSFSMTNYSIIPYHIMVVIGTLLTLLLGVGSIEKSNKIMMPLFFLIFLVLAIRVAFLPGAIEGYKFILIPDWSALKQPMLWVWAMGQAFFSLSLTGSGMIVYGAYLGSDEDIVSVAKQTSFFDTIAAILASFVIIPACFAYGVDVGGGPGLLFVTLPKILQNIPLGRLFSVLLYAAMIFAGISSLQNMFEVVGESLMYKFKRLNRKWMLTILCVICLGVGIHMHSIDRWGPWMDIISIYIIPIGATLGALSWFWVMKKSDLMDEINKGAKKQYGGKWYNIGRFVYVPLAVILCLIALFMKISF